VRLDCVIRVSIHMAGRVSRVASFVGLGSRVRIRVTRVRVRIS